MLGIVDSGEDKSAMVVFNFCRNLQTYTLGLDTERGK